MPAYRIKNILRTHADNPAIILRFACYRGDEELGAYTTRGKAALAISRAAAKDARAAFPVPAGRICGTLGLAL